MFSQSIPRLSYYPSYYPYLPALRTFAFASTHILLAVQTAFTLSLTHMYCALQARFRSGMDYPMNMKLELLCFATRPNLAPYADAHHGKKKGSSSFLVHLALLSFFYALRSHNLTILGTSGASCAICCYMQSDHAPLTQGPNKFLYTCSATHHDP
ncbi:hypothetical protein FPV67DRAFT_610495 [Lyophyllum atratum]|nr:hypothetical protein FPV67DRAFT_610495 [Lyophyllum atratum]